MHVQATAKPSFLEIAGDYPSWGTCGASGDNLYAHEATHVLTNGVLRLAALDEKERGFEGGTTAWINGVSHDRRSNPHPHPHSHPHPCGNDELTVLVQM